MRAKLTIAGLLLALVAVGFYWYSQRGMKLSETDTILIGEFSNAAGDPVFDGTLREALGVSLAQSPSLNLVSVEKVREGLRSLGRPMDSLIIPELAPRLCQRLGATVYLTGNIVKAGSGYSLRLDAARCSSDDSGVSTNSDAASKREALHALGVAAADLRGKFGEEPDSLQKFDLPLERATSASLDALAAFTEGRRLAREKGAIEAVPALKKAIELDPKFALAHSNLAVAYYNLNQNALAAEHIRQAFESADRQTVRDRLHITTLYYDLATGDVQKAIASYKEWVRLYPRDDIAKGNLSSEYFLIGDYEQAATLAQQALRLDPGSAAWYENLATAYIALQRLEEAQNILELAFARKLDDPSMHADLYASAFLRGEPAAMERQMVTQTGQNKNGQNLSVATLRCELQNLIRALLSFLKVTVYRLPQRGNPLPDGCGFTELRVLGDLHGSSGESTRLLNMSHIRFRVGLQSQEGIFTAGFAVGPGHAPRRNHARRSGCGQRFQYRCAIRLVAHHTRAGRDGRPETCKSPRTTRCGKTL